MLHTPFHTPIQVHIGSNSNFCFISVTAQQYKQYMIECTNLVLCHIFINISIFSLLCFTQHFLYQFTIGYVYYEKHKYFENWQNTRFTTPKTSLYREGHLAQELGTVPTVTGQRFVVVLSTNTLHSYKSTFTHEIRWGGWLWTSV